MDKKPEISFEDFQKLDLRLGTITEVHEFPEARKPAYQLTIDFGPPGIMKSSAQITDLYSPNDLKGKQVVAVVNFPDKQIANFMSECLVLGIEDQEGKVSLLSPDHNMENGSAVS